MLRSGQSDTATLVIKVRSTNGKHFAANLKLMSVYIKRSLKKVIAYFENRMAKKENLILRNKKALIALYNSYEI